MNGLTTFVLEIGWVAKIVLLILLILSVISWGIIIEKTRQFWKAARESARFLQLFHARTATAELYSASKSLTTSPISRLFKSCFREQSRNPQGGMSAHQVPVPNVIRYTLKSHLKDEMEVTVAEEMAILEKHLVFLATTVSVSPFLGLFGTVWGVMQAFISMGVKGSADISAVGPGIAEALITTVAGLAVAIPALFAYNFFIHRLKKFEGELEIFSFEMVKRVEGNQSV